MERSPIRTLLLIASLTLAVSTGCRVTSTGQNTLGTRLYQEGRYAEALQQFQAAQTSDPTNPDTYYNLASTYHKMGVTQKNKQMVDQAEALYNQCLDLAPNHVECHRGLAVLLVETDRSDRAFTLLKNWSTANPQLADARIELGRLYEEFGQTKSAEQCLDEAIALNPANAKAWAARGQLREKSGDLEQALQNYQQSLAVNNLQPELVQRVAALNIRMAERSLSAPPTGGTRTVQQPNPAAPATPRY